MPSSTLLLTQQIPLTCSGHTRPVVQLGFSNFVPGSGYLLISACKDGKPILRDGATGDWLGTFVGHKGAVWSAMLNADTSRAVTASADYTAKVWNAFTGQELVSDTTVVTGSQDKTVRVFDIARPEHSTAMATHDAAVRSVKWSRHKRVVVSAGDKRILMMDLRSPSAVKTLELTDSISNISLTSDGRILSCALGRRILAWDLDAFKVIKDMALDYEPSVAAINPQRTRIVTGGKSDLLIRSCEFESGKELEMHKGHHGPVHDACFSPDGEIYATGSEDGTVRLWQANPGAAYGLWQLRKI
ncbi:hypothetical protein H4R26_000294 [Coemansia thaxteri]|uniref:Serine-threonine kinase receptor-associated protein n=1 Tax=Coemansia thaxteri TaxID=2663907 RepID=A0A9W8BHU9_9FUNG|nr:hypothetical protein H4R26_000294 [Coemansia thaxteri]